jgi:ferredoxin
MSLIEVEQEKCKRDGICATKCPLELILQEARASQNRQPMPIRYACPAPIEWLPARLERCLFPECE